MQRKIIVPPGLGDFCWLAQKLINTGEKFQVVMPDGTPQRGHQLLELLPHLITGHEYREKLSYTKISKDNIQNTKRKWSQIKETEFYLSANQHLEAHRRIEDFLPDLPTSYTIEYATTPQQKDQAARHLYDVSKRYIGIYTSAYSNARNAGGWELESWFKLIRLIHAKNKDITFILIGASYDVGITEQLTVEMRRNFIPFEDTTGAQLGTVIEMLKRLSYFIGFPSGLSIINETLGKDGVMFYMKKDVGIINSWADRGRIEAGNIKECLFCEPLAIYDWIANEYKLFDKL